MKITYIHHSSFSVELERSVLLFDYFQGEIPEFDPEKSVYVFASHKHHDHYDKKIFELAERYPHILFILSGDIRMNSKYMDRIGIPNPRGIGSDTSGKMYPASTEKDNLLFPWRRWPPQMRESPL